MIHALQLWHGLMALVDEDEVIVRQVIQQCRRRFAWKTAREMARVVFDSVTVADLADHLQIEHGALVKALSFHQFALLFQFLLPPFQFLLDAK